MEPHEEAVTVHASPEVSLEGSPQIRVDHHPSGLGISPGDGSPLALSHNDDDSPSHQSLEAPVGFRRRASPSMMSATSAHSYSSHSPAASARTNNTTTTVAGGRTRRAAVRYKNFEDAQASPVLTKANRSVTVEVKRSAEGSLIGAVGSMQGWRRTMEDRHVLFFASQEAQSLSFAGDASNSVSPKHASINQQDHAHPYAYFTAAVKRAASSDRRRSPRSAVVSVPPASSESRCSSETVAPGTTPLTTAVYGSAMSAPTLSGGSPFVASGVSRTSTGTGPVSPGAVSVTFSMGRCASGNPLHGARMLSDSRRGSDSGSVVASAFAHHQPTSNISGERAMIGVFDGHRGPDAAAYASSVLPRMLAPMLRGGDVLGTVESLPSRRHSDQSACLSGSQRTHRRESSQSVINSDASSTVGSPTSQRMIGAFLASTVSPASTLVTLVAEPPAAIAAITSGSNHQTSAEDAAQSRRKAKVTEFITRAFQETDDMLRREHDAFKDGSMEARLSSSSPLLGVTISKPPAAMQSSHHPITDSSAAQSTTGGSFGVSSSSPLGGGGGACGGGSIQQQDLQQQSNGLCSPYPVAAIPNPYPLSNASFDLLSGCLSENASFVSTWAGGAGVALGGSIAMVTGGEGEASTPRDMLSSTLGGNEPATHTNNSTNHQNASPVDLVGHFVQKPAMDPGMQGATAHVVVVTDKNYLFCNLGDSRGYLVRRRVQRDVSPDDFAHSWGLANVRRQASRRSSPGTRTKKEASRSSFAEANSQEDPILLEACLETPSPRSGKVGAQVAANATNFTLRKTTDAPGLQIPHMQSYQGSPIGDRSRPSTGRGNKATPTSSKSNSPRFNASQSGGDVDHPSKVDSPQQSPNDNSGSEPPLAQLRTHSSSGILVDISPRRRPGEEVDETATGACSRTECNQDEDLEDSASLDNTVEPFRGFTVEAVPMSTDHRTVQNEKERQRVLDAGGFVVNNRVNGKLSVTRAFGDFDLKPNTVASALAAAAAAAPPANSDGSPILPARTTNSESAAVSGEGDSTSDGGGQFSAGSSFNANSSVGVIPASNNMPPLAPRLRSGGSSTTPAAAPSQFLASPPLNPISNTPDIIIVDRLSGAYTSSSYQGLLPLAMPASNEENDNTAGSEGASTPPHRASPRRVDDSPVLSPTQVHKPYPFAAYDIILVGCDGVWELQTAEVIGKRAVDAVEAVLQPVRIALLNRERGNHHAEETTSESALHVQVPSSLHPAQASHTPPMATPRGGGGAFGSKVVSPHKEATHDPRRWSVPSIGGLTVDGRVVRSTSCMEASAGTSRRDSSPVALQRPFLAYPPHSPAQHDSSGFPPHDRNLHHPSTAIQTASASLSPRSPHQQGGLGEDVNVSDAASSHLYHGQDALLLAEKLEDVLRDVVVASLNAACSVHCDPKGITHGCDNLSLGIMLVAA